MNIVAKKKTLPGFGQTLVVVEVVLVRSVALTRTVELQMNVVFLTNALIAVVRDVPVTQIAVPDITVVRKDIGTSLVSAVQTVLENLVPRAMTVVDRMKFVTGMQSDMNLDACR